jgi:hypothetical protein
MVHQRAVSILRWNRHSISENYLKIIRYKLMILCSVYISEENEEDFLSMCIGALLNTYDNFKPIDNEISEFIFNTIPYVRPYKRAEIILHHKNQLKENQNYSRHLAKLIHEKSIYGLNISEVIEEVKELPMNEVVSISEELVSGAKMFLDNKFYINFFEIIEILSLAYIWESVKELTEYFKNSIEDTVENKFLFLEARAYEIAANIEISLENNSLENIEKNINNWDITAQAIKKEDET